MFQTGIWLPLLLVVTETAAWLPISQSPLANHQEQSVKQRKLNGKFLHITDLHPDPFYKSGTDPFGGHPCHEGKGIAGYFGAEKTECDSPFSLINATFDWIRDNVRDEVDFVVWTGDSARHDNDEKFPRTTQGVEELNRYIVSKFSEVFGRTNSGQPYEIRIIPTYGNNDILPHNIFQPGPNRWTRKYLDIWKDFIPQEQRHSFARGGYFYTEVIPNKLAIFSLNTLYFFDSNAAVDGCDNPDEPGYEHFEWLRVQLEFLRRRKMKAILTGHVPPARTESKQSWDESCHQKYTLWLHQYRDVIVGNLFGHMNIDHFMFQDVRELKYKFKIDGMNEENLEEHDDRFTAFAKTDYLSELRETWGALPPPPRDAAHGSSDMDDEVMDHKKKKKMDKFLKAIGGPYGERFSVSIVSPSVVPNFYPTLRIVKYNSSGLENDHPALIASTPLYQDHPELGEQSEFLQHLELQTMEENKDDIIDNVLEGDITSMKHKKKKSRKKKPNFSVPKPPSKTAGPGPAYSPQTFSFISWRQMYANLTEINRLVADSLALEQGMTRPISEAEMYQLFKQHFSYKQEYHTKDDEVYHMPDLTMRSWIDLAQKIGRSTYDPLSDTIDDVIDDSDDTVNDKQRTSHNDPEEVNKHQKKKQRKSKTLKQNRLWHAFVKRAFVSSKTDAELQDDFG